MSPVPGAPTGVSVTPGDRRSTVNWADTATAKSYNLYRSTVPGSLGSIVNGGRTNSTNGAGWTISFIDDFLTPCAEGSFLSTYTDWSSYPIDAKDTYGQQNPGAASHYNPNRLSVGPSVDPNIQGNVLKMRLSYGSDGLPNVCAPFPRIPANGWANQQLYGFVSTTARCAAPVTGYKTAWLYWPNSQNWPPDGEIDWPEGPLNGTVAGFMHRQGATSGSDQDGPIDSGGARYTDWHTYGIAWAPNSCKFILDGVVRREITSRVPNTSMYYILQTETNLPGGPRPILGQECTVEVANFTMWKYTP